jgi:hypothetical protein
MASEYQGVFQTPGPNKLGGSWRFLRGISGGSNQLLPGFGHAIAICIHHTRKKKIVIQISQAKLQSN